MLREWIIVGLATLALLGGSTAATVAAPLAQTTVDVTVVRPTVLLQPGCDPDPVERILETQATVPVGQAVLVDGLGEARLRLSASVLATLFHDSCLQVATSGAGQPAYRLEKGTARINASGGGMVLETPLATVTINGSAFVHLHPRTKAAWVVVKSGQATVSGNGGQVEVSAGEQTWMETGSQPEPVVPAQREAVGTRFFTLADLTNNVMQESDLFEVEAKTGGGWIVPLIVVGSIVLLAVAGVVGLGRRRSARSQPESVAAAAGVRLLHPASGGEFHLGEMIPLQRGQLTFGRVNGNNVVLQDSLVSSRHARIVQLADGFGIEDLGSKNGTFVDDRKVTRQRLEHGDVIKLGQTRLVFQIGQAAPRPQPKPEREAPARPLRNAAYASLSIAQADGGSLLVPLLDKKFTIGRAENNDLVLRDPEVSSQHARILQQPDGCFIEDLESTNGTHVSGRRVGRQRLLGGEQIRLGDTIMTFALETSRKRTPQDVER